MVIPYQRLASETLESIIEAFICREGTDYGEQELSLKDKVARLKRQVISGEVFIVFDDQTDSVNLIDSHKLSQLATA